MPDERRDIGDVDAWVGVCIPAFRVIYQGARVRATRWLARTKLDYIRNFDLRTHVWAFHCKEPTGPRDARPR
jgi:hypothetical protein